MKGVVQVLEGKQKGKWQGGVQAKEGKEQTQEQEMGGSARCLMRAVLFKRLSEWGGLQSTIKRRATQAKLMECMR
jgi:hypothetical protein